VIDRDPAAALRCAATLAASGRDPGQVLRDLEIHGRELLTVQILGEVPAELRVTPDRDRRLAEQAGRLAESDAVRLLSLVSSALEATANGAQPRIQLELVLIKAAAPQTDPATAALLARIEQLEQRLAGTPSRPPAVPAPPPVAAAATHSAAAEEPAPKPEPPAAIEPEPSPTPAIEPEPVPVAPPPVIGGPADLQQVAVLWPAVVDIVRGGNAMLAALLDGARPTAMTERELTVAFDHDATFSKKKAENEDHRRAVADALRNVTGAALSLRYELAAPVAEVPLAIDGAIAAPEVSSEELVRRFVEELGAQEIDETDLKADG
jgi:DNA polymerase-3 subunit gamma/tau